MPGKRGPKPGPQDREKAISVAYLRLTGSLQTEAAEAVGIHHDTIGRWEKADWWPEIVLEASQRWLAGLAVNARESLMKLTDPKAPEPTTVRFVAERIVQGLEPPTTRTDVTTDGKPLDSLTIEYVKTPKADK